MELEAYSNTSMDVSSTTWLSDLLFEELENCNSFRQCNFNFLDDDEFLSNDIANVLEGENFQQQPLSSESYSSYSYPASNSETLINSSPEEETSLERPTKQRKTNTSTFNSSSPSSPSSPTSKFPTFDNPKLNPNPNSSPATNTLFCTSIEPKQNKVVAGSPLPQQQNANFAAAQTRKGPPGNRKAQGQETARSPPQAHDHIMAERKRREKLSQSLIALAALIPGLKKMDKASVLGDAIKYVKELQERLRILEEQSKNREVESVVMVGGKSQLSSCDHHSLSRDNRLPHVEARVSERDVLLRIHCQKQKGLLLKILVEIQSLHLCVVNSSVLPFGDSILDITIVAQMGCGYNLTTNDLVKNLRVATLKFMS